MAFKGNGPEVTNLNADNLTSGTVAVARGGTGLTSAGAAGNVLTSNGTTWTSAAPSAPPAPTTTQVLSATAGYTAGVIGSFTSVRTVSSGTVAVGSTTAASNLRGGSGDQTYNPSFTGTWRNLGCSVSDTGYDNTSLYVRIS